MDRFPTPGDALAHYGVKGMKWGKRRTRAEIDADSPDAATAKETKNRIKTNRGKTDSLSNAELKALIERMNLEQQYSNLNSKSDIQNKGRKIVNDVIENVGKQQMSKLASSVAEDVIKLVLK